MGRETIPKSSNKKVPFSMKSITTQKNSLPSRGPKKKLKKNSDL